MDFTHNKFFSAQNDCHRWSNNLAMESHEYESLIWAWYFYYFLAFQYQVDQLEMKRIFEMIYILL